MVYERESVFVQDEVRKSQRRYMCEKRGRSVPRFIKQAIKGEREKRFGLTITDLFPGEWEV